MLMLLPLMMPCHIIAYAFFFFFAAIVTPLRTLLCRQPQPLFHCLLPLRYRPRRYRYVRY